MEPAPTRPRHEAIDHDDLLVHEWRVTQLTRLPLGTAARGRLRIYLGYAPGAGTTCALLSEGRRARGARHRRGGGERGNARPAAPRRPPGRSWVVPAAKVLYRGTLAEEMDLGAVLARRPAVALVDDFAHRNAPGSRHRARWQDVEDLLAAGIDVISTVRRWAPGFPGRRDGEDHRRRAWAECARSGRPRGGRGRAGGRGARGLPGPAGPRPHLPGRPGGGSAEWLVPDGEPVGAARARPAVAGRRAGRRPAATPSRWRRSWRRAGPGAGGGRAQRWPGGRDPDPPGGPDRRPVRRGPAGGARRPARPPGRPGRAVLAAQRRLAESAGGTYHHLADQDIPAALLAFAHAHNATQLVLGATPRTWRAALRPAASIRSRVIRHGGGLDVHIVTCTPTAIGVPATAWWAT